MAKQPSALHSLLWARTAGLPSAPAGSSSLLHSSPSSHSQTYTFLLHNFPLSLCLTSVVSPEPLNSPGRVCPALCCLCLVCILQSLWCLGGNAGVRLC